MVGLNTRPFTFGRSQVKRVVLVHYRWLHRDGQQRY